MRALVLGGCGFIGSHLIDALLVAGHRVRVYDREHERYRAPFTKVDYRFGDFSDAPKLAEALEGVDVVYHLISTTVPSTSNLDPVADVNGNLVNTLKLLQLMYQKGIRKIVYLSSGGTVYGIPDAVPMSETHPLRPICSYGVIKVAIENYLQMYSHSWGLQYVVLRASNPYGERQGHVGVQGVIATFMRKMLGDEPIEIWGDGNVIRDFIYVGDLALLCVLAGEAERNLVLNAGSGTGHSINQIVSMLSAVSGKVIQPTYKSGRGYDVSKVVLDIALATETLGWKPSVELATGLERTWVWQQQI